MGPSSLRERRRRTRSEISRRGDLTDWKVILLVVALAGCARLSRVEVVERPGARYLDATSGVRVGTAVRVDLLAGYRTDLVTGEARPVAEPGLQVPLGKAARLAARAEVTSRGDVTAVAGVEIEW